MDLVQWIISHFDEMAAILLGLLAVAELVVRLTPTKADDGFVERLGKWIRKALDFLKVPNPKK